MTTTDTTTMGQTNLTISQLGVGAWAWGGSFFWGQTPSEDMNAAYTTSLDHGINLVDTAELYGGGRSERNVGQFVAADDREVFIATKFMPMPWRLGKGALVQALKRSLERLKMKRVHLYQIHWPMGNTDKWVNALVDAMDAGLTEHVGVSNFGLSLTKRSVELLDKRGYKLTSNQVEYSLLDRRIEFSGLLDYCREQSITILAYSPIAKGVLTGKYTPDDPPSGPRRRQYNPDYLRKIQPLITLLREIGQAHDGKTPAQVALNWTICKGTVPIPGAKNATQAADNAGALGWRLTDDQLQQLDNLSQDLSP